MNHFEPPFDDERQFNLPGFLWGQFIGNNTNNPFPGHPGGQYPEYPGGQFPGSPGGGQTGGPPTTPPPPFTPTQSQFQTFAVDPGGIRGCMFRFTYIWLRRDSFWFYPTFVGRNSIAGFRWSHNRWVYFGIDLDKIQSFQCF